MKKMFVLAGVMIMLGVSLFALTSCSFGGKISNLLNSRLEEKTTTVSEEFNSISIDTKVADIELVPTDGEVKVVSYDHKKVSYDVKVENGELKIEISDARRWYERIFNFGYSSKLTVYLPEGHYGTLMIDQSTGDVDVPGNFTFDNVDISLSTGDVSFMASVLGNVKIDGSTGDVEVANVTLGSLEIDVSTGDVSVSGLTCASDLKIDVTTGDIEISNITVNNFTSNGNTGKFSGRNIVAGGFVYLERSTGDIEFSNVSCGDMTLNLSTGDTELSHVRCKNLISDASTGKLEMNDVIASESFNIDRNSGKVIFDRCDANEILIETGSGDVKGSLLSEKIFITKANSGKIDVPETISGGKCKITTSSGDIKVEIKN